MKMKKTIIILAFLVFSASFIPHAAMAQQGISIMGFYLNPWTDSLVIDGAVVPLYPPVPPSTAGGGGDNDTVVNTNKTCPNGVVVDVNDTCPQTTKVCPDMSVIDVSATCPPTTKVCSDNTVVNINDTCPSTTPTTKTCPDGSIVSVSVNCPPTTCQDSSATNFGGALPCAYPPQNCTDSKATNQGSPLPCTYPPTTCQDSSATNFGDTLPCTYKSALCTDPDASNYASSLPCIYDPKQFCNDPAAKNYSQSGVCVYPPQITTCQDSLANNYGGTLPCTYPAICSDSSATNYGHTGSCTYPQRVISTTCQDSTATNYGESLPCIFTPVCTTGSSCSPVTPTTPAVSDDNSGTVTNVTTGAGGSNQNVQSSSGFTLSGDISATVGFIGGIGANSEQRSLSVNPVGGFNSNVSVNVQSTSCQNVDGYSFDYSPFATAPTIVMHYLNGWYASPSGTIGLPVKIHFSQKIDQACTVIFYATGGGVSDTHTMTIYPDRKDPKFIEI